MEVTVAMGVMGKEEAGRIYDFKVLGFYPGSARKGFPKGNFWMEWMDDKSVLPVGNLMERSFRLNKLVMYKEADVLTQKLIVAHQQREVLEGSVYVYIKTKGGERIWVGKYEFDFYVKYILANQSDDEGNRWDSLQLDIVDKTEDIGLPE